MENNPVIGSRHPQSPTQGLKFTAGADVPDLTVFSSTEKMEAGRGLELGDVPSPGSAGQGVLLQGFSPRGGLQVRLAGPVGMSALGAAEAELPPAGAVQGEDELPPSPAHLAAAAQVGEGEIGQDNPPQLHGEAPHLHGSRAAGWGSTVTAPGWKQAATTSRHTTIHLTTAGPRYSELWRFPLTLRRLLPVS